VWGFEHPVLSSLTVFFGHKAEVLADQPSFKRMFEVVPNSMSQLLPHGGAPDSAFLQSRGENPAVLLRAAKLHNHTGLQSKVDRVGTMHGNTNNRL